MSERPGTGAHSTDETRRVALDSSAKDFHPNRSWFLPKPHTESPMKLQPVAKPRTSKSELPVIYSSYPPLATASPEPKPSPGTRPSPEPRPNPEPTVYPPLRPPGRNSVVDVLHSINPASNDQNGPSPQPNPPKKLISDVPNIIKDIPEIGQNRFLMGLTKYPGLVSIICGSYILWAKMGTISKTERALAILAIVCGVYTFTAWVLSQANHFTLVKTSKYYLVFKLAHSFSTVVLSLGYISVVILVIQDLGAFGIAGGGAQPTPTPTPSNNLDSGQFLEQNLSATMTPTVTTVTNSTVTTVTNSTVTTTTTSPPPPQKKNMDLVAVCAISGISAVVMLVLSVLSTFHGVVALKKVARISTLVDYEILKARTNMPPQ